ncbi:MAG: hypothetical protein ABDH49_02515 [Candidatus Hydrothermales bacterium]
MKLILHGIYPRSEKLVEASRDFDRKRIGERKLKEIIAEDIKELIKIQQKWDYITNGQFYFQDLLRPFAELSTSVEVNGLKRFYETNFFIRKLNFKKFEFIKNKKFFEHYLLCDNLFKREDNLVFTFPFIVFFSEFSENISLSKIGELLLKVIEELNSWKNKIIIFYEPTIGYRSLKEEEKEISLWFCKKLKEFKNLKFFIHTFFFDVKSELEFLFSLDFDGYGFDFYSNSSEHILKEFPQNKTILLGLINTDSTLIEKREIVVEFFEKTLKFIKNKNIYICPSGPPELLPREVMDQKIKNLLKS